MIRRIGWMLVAAGCAKDGPETSADTGSEVPEAYEPTWAGMERLFVDHCDRCHPAQNGVDLHTDLANHTTTPVTTYLPWVTPGDPDQSWMWVLVSGQAGIQMMPDDGLLPLETVDPMRVWIEDGAPFE